MWTESHRIAISLIDQCYTVANPLQQTFGPIIRVEIQCKVHSIFQLVIEIQRKAIDKKMEEYMKMH